MGWITEAAGLVHGVCPEQSFEEINLCLTHKYHTESFPFLRYCESEYLGVGHSNANPYTLTSRKLPVYSSVHYSVIMRVSDDGSRK